MRFARIDRSPMARWWWTVDRWSLFALAALMAIGVLLSLSASPAVAERIGYGAMHFVRRHLLLLPPALALLFIVSLQTPRTIRRLALALFIVSLALLALTLLIGVEIKGARRWIELPGLALQPSEFVKPSFAVIAGWLFAEQKQRPGFPGNAISAVLFLIIIGMLVKQPDLGMAVVVAVVWFAQFFMIGLRLYWVALAGLAGVGGLFGAYTWMPHVRARVEAFLNPNPDDSYQVDRSLQAFAHGGVWGVGPGEGTIKNVLPDAHADFVFAVAGEELGLVACLLLIALFAFIVLRGLSRLLQEGDLFVVVAAAGLLIQFGLQAAVNMSSALQLIPAKGMTLPFLSYGGSSLLALGLGMGMLLALTRRRLGGGTL